MAALQLTAERATSFLKWHNIITGSIKFKLVSFDKKYDINLIDIKQFCQICGGRTARSPMAPNIMHVPSTNRASRPSLLRISNAWQD